MFRQVSLIISYTIKPHFQPSLKPDPLSLPSLAQKIN
jgi:hypothetical protein